MPPPSPGLPPLRAGETLVDQPSVITTVDMTIAGDISSIDAAALSAPYTRTNADSIHCPDRRADAASDLIADAPSNEHSFGHTIADDGNAPPNINTVI